MAEIRVKTRPWQTPNFIAIEGQAGGDDITIAIKDAPPDTVREMVVQWMAEVYRKAGMQPDWRFE